MSDLLFRELFALPFLSAPAAPAPNPAPAAPSAEPEDSPLANEAPATEERENREENDRVEDPATGSAAATAGSIVPLAPVDQASPAVVKEQSHRQDEVVVASSDRPVESQAELPVTQVVSSKDESATATESSSLAVDASPQVGAQPELPDETATTLTRPAAAPMEAADAPAAPGKVKAEPKSPVGTQAQSFASGQAVSVDPSLVTGDASLADQSTPVASAFDAAASTIAVPQAAAGEAPVDNDSGEHRPNRRQAALRESRLSAGDDDRPVATTQPAEPSEPVLPAEFLSPPPESQVAAPELAAAVAEVSLQVDAVATGIAEASPRLRESTQQTTQIPPAVSPPPAAGLSAMAGGDRSAQAASRLVAEVAATRGGGQPNAFASAGAAIGVARGETAPAAVTRTAPGAASQPVEMPEIPLTVYQQSRIMQRVMGGLQRLDDGSSQVQLRLHPPELGALQMSLSIRDNVVSGTMIVEHSAVAAVVQSNMTALGDQLAQQGYQLGQFTVEVGEQDVGGGGGHFAGQSPSDSGGRSTSQENRYQRSYANRLASAAVAASGQPAGVVTRGGFEVRA